MFRFGRTLTLLLLLCSSCIQIGIAFSIASTFLQRSLRSPSNSEHKILPLAISSSSSYVSSLAMSVGDGANSNNNKGTIAVFGGTGLLGRECVYQALRSGRKVVVLARDPSKMLIPLGSGGSLGDSPLVDDKLTMLEGDVTEQSAVDTVFSSCSDIEGVIVSLGGKTRLNGPTMLEDGTRCIISAMKRLSPSTKRIAAITAVGCGDSENQAPFYYKALMYTVMKSVYKDKNKQEELFIKPDGVGHDLEYCVIRPGGLGQGAPSGVINVIEGKAGSIHRADVAHFAIDAVTDPTFPYVGKTPCISSVGGTGWVKEAGKGFDGINTA